MVTVKQKRKNSEHQSYEGWIALVVVGMVIMIAIPVPEVYLFGFFGGCALLLAIVFINRDYI